MTDLNDTRRCFLSRPVECRLLALSSLICLVLFLPTYYDHYIQGISRIEDWFVAGLFIVMAFIGHGVLVAFGSRSDQTILPMLQFIMGIGISYQYRLNMLRFTSWKDPSLWIVCSGIVITALMTVVLRMDRINILFRLSFLWMIATWAILAALMIWGNNYRGGRYGPGLTTPTEFIKPLLVVLFAIMVTDPEDLTNRRSFDFRQLGKLIAFWIILPAVFCWQRDLGMVAAVLLFLITQIDRVTGKHRYFVAGVSILIAGGYLVGQLLPHGQKRFEAFWTPFDHPDSSGYQIIQSLFALFHGEVLGCGLGQGLPGKIPLAYNDFVYAALAEEVGLIGCVLILTGFCYLSFRGYGIALSASNYFQSVIAAGSATFIWIQVLLNVGGVIKLIPMTGVPLPCISKGGSACIMFTLLSGLILIVSDSSE